MKEGSGFFGHSLIHRKAGKKGGEKTLQKYGIKHFQKIGVLGGSLSGGNFKNDPEKASKAGKKSAKLYKQRHKYDK